MATATEAASVLDADDDRAERTDSSGRMNAKGVNAVGKKKGDIHPSDEDAALAYFLDDANLVPDEIELVVPRTGLTFVFRNIMEDELKQLQIRAGKNGKRLPNGNREVDLILLYRLILVETMTTPNLRDPAIIAKFARPEDALKAILRSGEIENLAEKVMKLSGFDNDSVMEKDEVPDDMALAKN